MIKKAMISVMAIVLALISLNIDVYANTDFDFGSLAPGEVKQQKRANWVDYANGIAEITFDVVGGNSEEPMDVAILYDNSGSMQSIKQTEDYLASGWNYASNAATTFVQGLLKSKDNNVALIPFSDVLIDGNSYHAKPTDFFETHELLFDAKGNPDIHKMTAVNTIYGGVEAGQMTEEEFYQICEQMLGISPSQLKEGNNIKNALIPFTNEESKIVDAIQSLYPSSAGTTNYKVALEKAKEYFETSSTAKQKIIVMISDGRPDQWKEGINVATALKQSGVTIYTIGAGLSNVDAGSLKAIASKENGVPLYNMAALEDLGAVLAGMRKQFDVAAHNAVITDQINTDYFTYYEDETYRPTVNGNVISEEELQISDDQSTITWNIDKIKEQTKTLKFYVKVKDELLNEDVLNRDESFLNQAGLYETNKKANLTYTEVNTNVPVLSGHEMTSPKLEVNTATLQVVYRAVDKDGQVLYDLNTFISNQKALHVLYQVEPSQTYEKDGVVYTLVKSGNETQEVTFTEEKLTEEVVFTFIEQKGVTFDANGYGQFSDDNSTLKTIIADADSMKITELPTLHNIPSNMYFTGWNTKPDGSGVAFTNESIVEQNLTVYAQYAYYPVNVVFQDGDGTIYKEDMVAYGKDAIAPENPTKEGYIFKGWDKSFTNVTSDLVVQAVWEKNAPVEDPKDEPELPDDSDDTEIVPPAKPEQPAPSEPVQPNVPNAPVIIAPTPVNPVTPIPNVPVTTPPVETTPDVPNTNDTPETPEVEGNVTEDVKENETPLAKPEGHDDGCIIHIFMLLLTIVYGVYGILRIVGHKKEVEETAEEATQA